MSYDIGPRIGIDGEAEFRKAIQNINTNIRTLGTEMLAVTSAYDANDKSAAALTARNEVLVKQIDAQKEKLAKLQEGLAASAEKYGDSDEKTQRWQQTVNKATADLNKMERELAENTKELGNQGSALDGLKDKLSSFGSGLASAAKAAAAGLAAVTAAAGAMVGAVVKGVSSVAEYGDNIDKMSQKLGMSAEAYQEWDFIMQHCGTSIESMQSSMKTLASAAEKGNKAFSQLGMSQDEIAGMSQEDLFSATIAALQNVSDETERTYLAGQLLGRGATELGPLLNTSAQDVEAMRQQVHELGGVMSNESVAASAAFQDSLQNLQTGIQGLGRGALADFLPAVTEVMDGLTALISGNSSGLALVSQGLEDFTANLSSVIPTLLETGSEIVQSLLGAITENLPQVIESGAGVLMEFVNGVVRMLPQIAGTALELITTLASGIAGALPELVPTVVDVVLQIVETLTDPNNLSNLIDAALEIIVSLAEGLINALPKLAERVPEIIVNIVTTLANNLPKITESALKIITTLAQGLIQAIPELVKSVPKLVTAIVDGFKSYNSKILDIGKNIVSGVWQGIQNMGSWIKEKVSGFFSGIVDSVKGVLGIQSPSKVFAGIGGYMAEGLGDGFDREISGVQRRIDRSMAELAGNASATVRVSGSVGGPQEAGTSSSVLAELPALIAEAVHKEFEGMGVYLQMRKVGEMTSQWQANNARAMGV